jgi:pimeloyl-ACP methyl ester carboxylesterase
VQERPVPQCAKSRRPRVASETLASDELPGSLILRGMTGHLSVRTVTANGLRFGVLEAGSGPLALCLHGFPDSAHTWRFLLPALAEGGFHAVAPFMRGYAPTEIPADGCFGVGALVADAVGLHDALGGDDRAVLIGHDWGAEAAYGAAAFASDRWRRVVTLAVPPLALDAQIFGDYDQLKRFFYLFLLKTPVAESVLAADDMAFLDRLWQDWSPGYDARDDLRNVKQCLREERNLAAAIAYYRTEEPGLHNFRTDGMYAAEEAALAKPPPQPTLYLHGDRDGCIGLALVADAKRHLAPGSRMKVVEGAGHFPHLEQSAAVNDQILAWISA